MKLARLATLAVDGNHEGLKNPVMRFGECEVGALFSKQIDNTLIVVAAATIRLKYLPKKTGDAKLVVPPKSRTLAEEAIEHYANILTVTRHLHHHISSPIPTAAFIPESETETDFLAGCSGFVRTTSNRGIPIFEYELDIPAHATFLSDRLDGVALLGEALRHRHSTGRFREVIRLFERAFGYSGHRLIQPLLTFLETSSQGYDGDEVKRWIGMRDGITHADHRNKILFEGDVACIIGRVVQAGYDVLLNKLTWRRPDSDRRNVWTPPYGTSSSNADLFMTAGSDFKVSFQTFDEFLRFPFNLGGVLTGLPNGWWAGHRIEPNSPRPSTNSNASSNQK